MTSIREIKQAACVVGGVTMMDLMSHRRARRVAAPRMAACIVAYETTPATLMEIGRAFDRDHTTVMHALRQRQRRDLVEAAQQIRARLCRVMTAADIGL